MRNQSRYPGTRPFLEEDRHLFFGRDHEKKKLSNLIVLEKLVVLFGKSGYGKSSLLNAGVIPYLRHTKHHFPIKIRLNPQETESKELKKKPPLEILKDHLLPQIEIIKNDLEQKNGVPRFLAEKLDLPKLLPEDLTATLWYYIKFIQLTKQINEATTLIFYQFEELFRYFDDSEQVKFGRSIAVLLNSNPPDEVLALISENIDSFTDQELDQLYEPLNLKVVLSVASDHLSLLNKLKRSLPEIFKYTYELKALNKLQAQKALEGPALKEEEFNSPKFSFDKKAIAEILNYLIKVKNKEGIELENQDIETFQLQLIGKYAEEKIIAKKKKTEQIAKLKAPLNKQKENKEATKYEFNLKDLGEPSNILKKFYNKTIAGLLPIKGQRVRKLIEKGLIIGGNRVPMSGSVIKRDYKVSEETLGKLEAKHLLRSDFKLKDGRSTKSYEISHFNLIKPIQEASRRRKRNWLWILVFILLLIIAGLIAWVVCLSNQSRNVDPVPPPIPIIDSLEVSNGVIINAIATSTALPYEGEAPLEVEFTFSEIKPIREVSVVTYNWDFGDGTTSSNNEPVLRHTYKTPGDYRACLTVIASDSLVRPPRTEEVLIVVRSTTPVVNIKAEPDSGNVPLEVNFSPIIPDSISIANILWEFNDGGTSEERDPLHTFVKNDTFNVKLTIWDIDGNDYPASKNLIIGKIHSDSNNKAPIAKISVTRFAENPLKVAFDGSGSTDDVAISEYLWEFNDGKTSPETSPIHTFDSFREYDVRLTVWDHARKKDSANVTIKITESSIDSLVILPSDTLGIAPFKVDFEVSNAFRQYKWIFPDSTYSIASPTYVFDIVGTYDVHLTVTDINGRPYSTKTTITVNPPPPIAKASASVTEGKVPLTVEFDGSGSTDYDGTIVRYDWDFGDSHTSNDSIAVHTFNTIDTLDVQLTVTNKHGLIDRDTIQIRVLPDPSPVAKIKTKVISNDTIPPLTVEFDGSGSTDDGIIVSYDWDFGDGHVSNGDITVHTFDAEGTYNVKLTVVDDQNQPDDAFTSINVNPCSGDLTWLERFICIQDNKLPLKLKGKDGWRNWRIPPDSLNLVGVVLPDSLNKSKAFKDLQVTLLFFFTKEVIKKERSVYKFQIWLNNNQSDMMMQTQRFNINDPIKKTKSASIVQDERDSINQAKIDLAYRNTNTIRKYMGPDTILTEYYQSSNTNKVLAELFEQKAIKKESDTLKHKRINTFYTLFEYSDFDDVTKQKIETILKKLEPSKKE